MARQARVMTDEDNTLLDDDVEVLELAGAPDDAVKTGEEQLKHLTKEWMSPIYTFFDPTPLIIEINGRHAHDFECTRKKCWGTEVVAAADGAKDADEVKTKIVGGSLCNGTIMALFEQQGKGKGQDHAPGC
ncbi:hypothetical protein BS17DRAFT_767259 [Gyrodon lividus]|nr:hypothetical protein BS17DRAFT_767259 [Gyrodon lividus]